MTVNKVKYRNSCLHDGDGKNNEDPNGVALKNLSVSNVRVTVTLITKFFKVKIIDSI